MEIETTFEQLESFCSYNRQKQIGQVPHCLEHKGRGIFELGDGQIFLANGVAAQFTVGEKLVFIDDITPKLGERQGVRVKIGRQGEEQFMGKVNKETPINGLEDLTVEYLGRRKIEDHFNVSK